MFESMGTAASNNVGTILLFIFIVIVFVAYMTFKNWFDKLIYGNN